MFGLEKYKDAFGKPGSFGLRKYRIMGVAIYDLSVVMICCYFISWFTGYSYWITLVVILLLGIIVHRMFDVKTAVDRFLFPTSL
jgi:galactitol-specific phosphotransferase system IIC component